MGFVLKTLISNKKFVFFIFFISLFIRFSLFYFFLSKDLNYLTADSGPYNQFAMQLAKNTCINQDKSESQFYRLPGYPIFLAFFYKLFEYDVNKVLFIQVLLACFIPILIFLLFLYLFPKNMIGAKIASFYTAIHLGFSLFSGLLMTESLFLLFFLFFLIFFLPSFELFFCNLVFFNFKKIFWAGIFLGIASLIRPVGHYLILVSIFLLFFSNVNFLNKLKAACLLFVGWLLIVMWLLLRNYFATGYIFFHTLPGSHFLNHSATYIAANTYNMSYLDAKNKLLKELRSKQIKKIKTQNRNLNEIEACILTENLAFKYIKKHPFLFLRFSLKNILKTIFNPFFEEFFFIWEKKNLENYYGYKKTIFERIKNYFFPKIMDNWLVVLYYFELFSLLFVLTGFIGFIYNSFFSKLLLNINLKVLPFIGLFIVITLAAGFARLRLPVEPLIIVLSINFWSRLLIKWRILR